MVSTYPSTVEGPPTSCRNPMSHPSSGYCPEGAPRAVAHASRSAEKLSAVQWETPLKVISALSSFANCWSMIAPADHSNVWVSVSAHAPFEEPIGFSSGRLKLSRSDVVRMSAKGALGAAGAPLENTSVARSTSAATIGVTPKRVIRTSCSGSLRI
jgi:hypothetical protein